MVRGAFGAAEFRIEITHQQLENGILRIVGRQRFSDEQSPFILEIEVAQVLRQIETHLDWGEDSTIDSHLHLANSLLAITAWNAHEESQYFYGRRERVNVVVVKAEAGGGVGILRIDFERVKKFGTSRNPGMSDRAIFAL